MKSDLFQTILLEAGVAQRCEKNHKDSETQSQKSFVHWWKANKEVCETQLVCQVCRCVLETQDVKRQPVSPSEAFDQKAECKPANSAEKPTTDVDQ